MSRLILNQRAASWPSGPTCSLITRATVKLRLQSSPKDNACPRLCIARSQLRLEAHEHSVCSHGRSERHSAKNSTASDSSQAARSLSAWKYIANSKLNNHLSIMFVV